MDARKIESLLLQPGPIRCYGDIGSTNTAAKAWALEGAPHGAAVLAETQHAGHGRRGRDFFSPPGGLYMSVILDTGEITSGLVTTLAAVSVLRSLQALTGKALQIKWVNDLLFEGKKVCGILAERVFMQSHLDRVIVGIGINTAPVIFPPEIADTAGTLAREGVSLDLEELAAGILNDLLANLPLCPRHMDAYRANCVTLGRQVRFIREGRLQTGLAVGTDLSGALLVDTREGSLRLEAGEVSVRGTDGAYY